MGLDKSLQRLLKEKNFSATELAKTLGIPSSTVHDWLAGRVPRNLDQIRQVAEFFKVSTHEILFNEPDPRSLLSDILEGSTEIHSGLYQITVKKVSPKRGK